MREKKKSPFLLYLFIYLFFGYQIKKHSLSIKRVLQKLEAYTEFGYRLQK